ncbi:MAG: MlaD family protein [Planctomycetota bacterium]
MGLLLVGSAVLFAVLLVGIVGVSFGSDKARYRMLFDESVKGLVVGSRVNFQGVPIGAVSDLRFVDGSTMVEIEVDRERAILQEDTVASLDRAFVTGQVTIELEGYRSDATPLVEGGQILTAPSALTELTRSMPDVIASFEGLLGELRGLAARGRALLDDDNTARLARTLQNFERASEVLPDRLAGALAQIEDAGRTLVPPAESALVELQGFLAEGRGAVAELRETTAALRGVAAGEDAMAAVAGARRAIVGLERLEREIGAATTRVGALAAAVQPRAERVLGTAQEALLELQALARMLRAAPASLLYGQSAREIAVPGAAPRR